MRGPRRPEPRKHLSDDEIAALLATAATRVAEARRALRTKPSDGPPIEGLFVAEQTQLLVRLAADTGARRGELAVLRLGDLDGRVLSIERNLSLEVLGPTKSNRNRRLTIGATTAAMIHKHFRTWKRRVGTHGVVGDWIFAPDHRRLTHARADLLSTVSNDAAPQRSAWRCSSSLSSQRWHPTRRRRSSPQSPNAPRPP
jgi:integrase